MLLRVILTPAIHWELADGLNLGENPRGLSIYKIFCFSFSQTKFTEDLIQ